MIGIYGIHNTTEGKWYIGSSKDINARIYTHKRNEKLKKGIFADISDFDEIEFKILKKLDNDKSISRWENYYIGKHDSINNGYNKILSTVIPKKEKQTDPKSKSVKTMNQMEIAEKTGISQSQVSKIFSGKPIGKTTAKKLSKIIGKKWNNIIVMDPDKIKKYLIGSLK